MVYLSEDPTLLAGLLLVLAGGFVVALRVTQQGKYLVRAMIAAGLAAAVVVVEWIWVTDNERIEQVVYGLRQAVANSDVEGVLSLHDAGRPVCQGGHFAGRRGDAGPDPGQPEPARFEIVRISSLETSAGEQSRRGTADVPRPRQGDDGHLDGADKYRLDGGFDLVAGLAGDQPGVWKVNRITPVQLPRGRPGDARRFAGRATARSCPR